MKDGMDMNGRLNGQSFGSSIMAAFFKKQAALPLSG